uniref:chitinase n=1 Tax=Hypocrella siamensis TaxID=696354 RepID=A0A0P0CAT0_9HYPO
MGKTRAELLLTKSNPQQIWVLLASEFCGDGCQKNSKGEGCGQPTREKCASDTNLVDLSRRVAYFNMDSASKSCSYRNFSQFQLGALTDLNLAFVNFGDDFQLKVGFSSLLNDALALKLRYPSLRVSIAVGGWDFSDPPSASRWSNSTPLISLVPCCCLRRPKNTDPQLAVVSTHESRRAFITSVYVTIQNYGLDGVDLDWEYPSALDRGGSPDDAANFVALVSEMRDYFDVQNPRWTITVTLPTSYWYLRGFDLENMNRFVSWFNLMSYDLAQHGTWDHDNRFTGPYLRGHTDISEIQAGLDILRRNHIPMENVAMGMAFYGRSFTLGSDDCVDPNGVCQFSRGGRPGDCSEQAGILTYTEIVSRNDSLGLSTFYNSTTTVKYNVYEGDQWISYDDAQSWEDKRKFLSEQCFGGVMIWSLDQDDDGFDALYGLMGDVSSLELSGGPPARELKEKLAHEIGAFTGQDCFVTPRCTDGSHDQQGPEQVCPNGYQSMSTAHAPRQAPGHPYYGECAQGWYRHICCPRDALPKDCSWSTKLSKSSCLHGCTQGQFMLNSDSFEEATGDNACYLGRRAFCCDSTRKISECVWSGCQKPDRDKPDQDWDCGRGFRYQTVRRGWGPGCEDEDGGRDPLTCPEGKVKVAEAKYPSSNYDWKNVCDTYTLAPGMNPRFPYCCAPPSQYDRKWPVDPEKLFKTYYDDPSHSDVVWSYNDEKDNNNKINPSNNQGPDLYGSDSYGFVMLDGPEGSIDNTFAATFTVVREEREIRSSKRSLLTSNQTLIDSVFDHSEETLQIYCNFPLGAKECERLWLNGPEDTIVRLPSHVGEGPFARLVSIKELDSQSHSQLPSHHLEHRSTEDLRGPLYEMKIDYDFQDIVPKDEDKPVMMRIDFTNLYGYWDEMTNAEPDSNSKRDEGVVSDWHSRVQRAIARDEVLRKRSSPVNFTVPMAVDDVFEAQQSEAESGHIDKRWWGTFTNWLSRMTTVTKSEIGDLPLSWGDTINLFRAKSGCPGRTFSASLSVDLEAEVEMDATYAYYFSGTFVPPSTPDVYVYFGMNPNAYIGVKITGDAQMQYKSEKKKIIDTLAHPGLAVKGIAAVGSTLDIYGQIAGKVTIHGEAKAGARVNFGKAEAYWPQSDEASQKYEKLLGIDSKSEVPHKDTLEPRFEAGVEIDASLDVTLQPQANVGIKIGGGKLVAGKVIMDAQLSGFVTGTLSFQASGSADTSSKQFRYSYGVYVFYNIGYSAKATVLGIIDWALGPRQAYNPSRRLDVYGPIEGTIPLTADSKRDLIPALIQEQPDPNNGSARLLDARANLALEPSDPQFSQPITCPAGAAGWRLPELRYNCDILGDQQIPGQGETGRGAIVPGVCSAWLGLDPFPETLTFSKSADRVNARRGRQCPRGYCGKEEKGYREATGSDIQVHCDETPPASSEEGGDYLPEGSRSRLCVTAVQNSNYAGLFGNLRSNWGQMEPSPPAGGRIDRWVGWEDNAWTTEGTETDNRQRVTDYPTNMPDPDGIAFRHNLATSWVFKRNYTWSINTSPNQASSWFDATSREFSTTKYATSPGTPNGWDGVLCVLNSFGQDTYYQYKQDFNAYCVHGPKFKSRGFGEAWHLGRCKVSFGNTEMPTSKEWDIQHIEYLEDYDEDEEIALLTGNLDLNKEAFNNFSGEN